MAEQGREDCFQEQVCLSCRFKAIISNSPWAGDEKCIFHDLSVGLIINIAEANEEAEALSLWVCVGRYSCPTYFRHGAGMDGDNVCHAPYVEAHNYFSVMIHSPVQSSDGGVSMKVRQRSI